MERTTVVTMRLTVRARTEDELETQRALALSHLDDEVAGLMFEDEERRGSFEFTDVDEADPVATLRETCLGLVASVFVFLSEANPSGSATAYNARLDVLRQTARDAKTVAESFYGRE